MHRCCESSAPANLFSPAQTPCPRKPLPAPNSSRARPQSCSGGTASPSCLPRRGSTACSSTGPDAAVLLALSPFASPPQTLRCSRNRLLLGQFEFPRQLRPASLAELQPKDISQVLSQFLLHFAYFHAPF